MTFHSKHLQLYDYILCFKDEVQLHIHRLQVCSLTVDNHPSSKQVNLVWSRGLCSSNILYIGNRYIPFFTVALLVYCK